VSKNDSLPAGSAPLQCPCGGVAFEVQFDYAHPPVGEIQFSFTEKAQYRRQVLRCRICDHFVSRHGMDTPGLYSGEYVNSTYGDANGLRRNFERIINLDPGKSDNTGRVNRVCEFADGYFPGGSRARSILDVGSGLCVFLYRMKQAGWDCTALDPDQRSCSHAREVAGVNAICGDFMLADTIGQFDVISFNKVLEHVEDPVAMLAKARSYLAPGGFVYVELPDGEAAACEGAGREEFFIDHLHVFSAASFAALVERAGFNLLTLERLREPSTKFTLRGFVG
jgi:2-polyprenyl-3-methyl-5-hydroxy-6-metoxy-1,4-benzoquinol methylase